jgi:hypothetical protein
MALYSRWYYHICLTSLGVFMCCWAYLLGERDLLRLTVTTINKKAQVSWCHFLWSYVDIHHGSFFALYEHTPFLLFSFFAHEPYITNCMSIDHPCVNLVTFYSHLKLELWIYGHQEMCWNITKIHVSFEKSIGFS